ncbi:MAG: hypothetical protein ACKOQL_02970 [Actinomycetes bacterium]
MLLDYNIHHLDVFYLHLCTLYRRYIPNLK